MVHESFEALSARGEARRKAMLHELKAAVIARRRRRAAARWTAISLLVAAFAASRLVPPHREVERAQPAPAAAPGRTFAHFEVEVVRDRPGILEQHAVNDDSFIALLTEAGRPAGIIRAGGKVLLEIASGP